MYTAHNNLFSYIIVSANGTAVDGVVEPPIVSENGGAAGEEEAPVEQPPEEEPEPEEFKPRVVKCF